VDLVWDSTYSPSSYKQSAGVVAKGGLWLRLGPTVDATEAIAIAEGRGAKVDFTDFGRYWFREPYTKQIGRFTPILKEAVEFYNTGRVRPYISATVPFEPKAVQQATIDNASSKGGAGKQVVEVSKA